MKSLVPALAVVGLLSGCTDPVDLAAVGQAVMEADREFARAVAEHDVERFRLLVDPDAAFLGASLLRGRDAVVQGWAAIVRGEVDLSWAPDEVHVAASGDLAYTLGQAEIRTTTADGATQIAKVNYVTVWRKGPDGAWRAAVDAGTIPRPEAAVGSAGR